jgi:quinol monooxygenase YgiN
VIIGIADVFAQIPQRGAVERAMLAAQALAQQQAGCVSFLVAEVLGDPGHFLVVERWLDQRSLAAHYRSESFAAYQAAVAPLLVRDSVLELHVVGEALRPLKPSGLDIDQDD